MLMCFWRGKSTPAIRAIKSPGLALPLFVFRVYADHPHHTLAVDDLALVTDLLYRCSYFHKLQTLFPCLRSFASLRMTPTGSRFAHARLAASFITVNNSSAIQIVGRKLYRDFVAGKNADKVLAHFARDMRQNLVLVLQFHLEHGIRQRFQDHGHNFNRVFFTHSLLAYFIERSLAHNARDFGSGLRFAHAR